ncbi:hypothetical protein SAMN04487846_1439 [Microbacterium sp. cf046]|uniref:hypothetical protein n=1 Tax=Microbacterium sp. cf046 TaxID=1761803 RepID=UPI0008E15058|nr:hypothetical protein [Microbacterium sp. cf046]SFS01110.1 hypothetical protein SAMN04487846_1439 [Microbacterium sp. cf046]
MSAQHQQSRADRSRRSRHIRLAAVILLCGTLGACTAAEPPTPIRSAAAAESTTPPLPDGRLAAGTYRFDGLARPFEVTLPDGWIFHHGGVLEKDVGDSEGVFVWFGTASHVPANACQWPGTLTAVPPTVDGFADALAAQVSTTATAATEVAVGEYSGVEFDLSVEGVESLDDCSGSKICIHSENSSCTRWYHASVAQRETYRVLDLDGERAILTVGEYDDKSKEPLLAEAQAVFDSITFISG